MNALFGDATTAMPTPATVAERGSLIGSPGSLNIGRGTPQFGGAGFGASDAIPGLDIDPPDIPLDANGKPIRGRGRSSSMQSGMGSVAEGMGGWISRMVSRTRGEGGGRDREGSVAGSYRRVNDEED